MVQHRTHALGFGGGEHESELSKAGGPQGQDYERQHVVLSHSVLLQQRERDAYRIEVLGSLDDLASVSL